jgi:hypothetical protein
MSGRHDGRRVRGHPKHESAKHLFREVVLAARHRPQGTPASTAYSRLCQSTTVYYFTRFQTCFHCPLFGAVANLVGRGFPGGAKTT